MIQLKTTFLKMTRGLVPSVLLLAMLPGCGGSSSTSTTTTATTITLSPSSVSITVNGKQTITASATDSSGNLVTGLVYTWTSSSTSVATVDTNGVVTGVAAGSTNITAASSGVTSAAAVITVTPAVASISIAPTSASIRQGATQTFTATAKDSSGNAIAGVAFNWGNSNVLLATISSTSTANGTATITGLAPGTVLITATPQGVTSPAATLTITP